MTIYSAFPLARLRQIVADAVAVGLILLSIQLGLAVHRGVLVFTSLGRQLEDAGSGLDSTLSDAADAIGRIPFVGNEVRKPFDDGASTGQTLVQAGVDQQQLVQQLALILGLVVALVPIAVVLRYWLVRRIGFARRARTAAVLSRSEGGLELLALRALDRATPRAVLAVAPDAVARWRAGDAAVVRGLADLALRDAGVRMP